MKLKELTPRSNATYEEAGEIELGDGTYVSLYRYPGQKLRVQIKHPARTRNSGSVVRLRQGGGTGVLAHSVSLLHSASRRVVMS